MSNELIHQSSPYLKQHAQNPVHWKIWTEETLNVAVKKQKLILVSIGYSACHWCHVMEKESFEDNEVAFVMNEIFVSVKVDREERPDVDSFFMDALLMMNGHGGWPLNVICLPDGRPIYGGTYFPKQKWLYIITELQKLWKQNPQKLYEYADKMMEGLESIEKIEIDKNDNQVFENETYIKSINGFRKYFDFEHGGLGQAPKFPTPWNWICLNRSQSVYSEPISKKSLEITLEKMALGGIFDHAGGGFSRYSTDHFWHVPHFEKMLYDNAQLLQLYAEAYTAKPNLVYKQIIFKTLDFLETELLSIDSGFYCAIDADSDGEEGKFYAWTKDEFLKIIGSEYSWIADYFNITAEGNWEHGKNVLHINQKLPDFIKTHQFFLNIKNKTACEWAEIEEKAEIDIEKACQKLSKVRKTRIRPALDDKIITSWNALTIRAYVEALKIWPDEKRLRLIEKIGEYLWDNAIQNNNLYRIFTDKNNKINGFLDDYAFLIDAYLGLLEITGKQIWYERALQLCGWVDDKFFDKETAKLYFTPRESADLLVRKSEIFDSVLPSSSAVMCHNWLSLSFLSGKIEWKNRVETFCSHISKQMIAMPTQYACWIDLYRRLCYSEFDIIITGKDAKNWANQLQSKYLPNCKIYFSLELNEIPAFAHRFHENTAAYICTSQSCFAPIDSVLGILKTIENQMINSQTSL